jgi:hypothetical protein
VIVGIMFLILVAVNSLEGKDVPEGALDSIQGQGVSVSQLYESYAGILSLIQSFLRLPQGTVNSDHLKEDLKELK